jgi:hypothetical protein
MYRTLAMKELRETSLIWGFVMAAIAYAGLSILLETSRLPLEEIPLLGWIMQQASLSGFDRNFIFLEAGLGRKFATMSVVLAIGIGLLQTLGESVRGTYPFLLHRPMSRRRIIAVKLAVGAGLSFGISGGAILALGLWAATPGTHPSPFEWSMTAGVWRLWIVMPILYFGAFLTGIRPARWYASRLFPLIAAVFFCFLSFSFPNGFVSSAVITILVIACFIACIFVASEDRDYS